MHKLSLSAQKWLIFLQVMLPFSLFCQADWKLSKSEDKLKLWIKNLDGKDLKQFKLETTIKEDIKTMYRLMRDVENMHLWYDKVKSVKLLKKINDNEAIYLLGYHLPFPFEDRISTVKGKINFDEKKGVIKVNTEYYSFDLPENEKNIPVITTLKSSWEISDKHNGEILVKHEGYMNPGGNVPVWLVNESVTSGPFKSIKNMEKILDKY